MFLKAIRHIEDVEESAVSSLIVPTQLTKVPVVGSICFAEVGEGVLTHGRYSGDVRVTGPLSEKTFTLGIMIGGSGAKVNGQTITPGGIGLFPEGFEHEAQYFGGLDYLLFTVDRRQIIEAAGRDGMRLRKGALDQFLIGDPPEDRGAYLRATARGMVETLRANPDAACHPAAGRVMSEELLSLFLRGATDLGAAEAEKRSDITNGVTLVRKVEDWLREDISRPVSVDDISRALGYSRRSLQRAFRNELGMGPVYYLNRYRMSRARRDLAHPDSRQTTVTEIAFRWGFWDLGRFARSYHTLFGELPSETLRNKMA